MDINHYAFSSGFSLLFIVLDEIALTGFLNEQGKPTRHFPFTSVKTESL
ncbi:MAG: hypothetical protein JXR73_00805 [Candidatus Omnitrophica bacterium]|nr:hypothetical protein [Candidatus Omnitrophota bacterium]